MLKTTMLAAGLVTVCSPTWAVTIGAASPCHMGAPMLTLHQLIGTAGFCFAVTLIAWLGIRWLTHRPSAVHPISIESLLDDE